LFDSWFYSNVEISKPASVDINTAMVLQKIHLTNGNFQSKALYTDMDTDTDIDIDTETDKDMDMVHGYGYGRGYMGHRQRHDTYTDTYVQINI
jgi:hypothetical protein